MARILAYGSSPPTVFVIASLVGGDGEPGVGVHVDNSSFIISVRLVLACEFSDAELWKRASSKPLMLAALVLPADLLPHIIRLHAAIPMCGCRRVLGQGSCDNARRLSLLRSGCWCLCR